jgi:hypothetical protein
LSLDTAYSEDSDIDVADALVAGISAIPAAGLSSTAVMSMASTPTASHLDRVGDNVYYCNPVQVHPLATNKRTLSFMLQWVI